MFKIIAKYDWLMLRKDKMLSVFGGVLMLLIILASWNGLSRYYQRKSLENEIQTLEKESISQVKTVLSTIEKSGGVFEGGHFNDPRLPNNALGKATERFAVLPTSPFSVLAIGQSDLLPYYYRLTSNKRQALIHDSEIENAQILHTGSFDWAFLLVFILPLFIIAFCYNIVSSEREGGTLSLILSEPVPFKIVVFYKFIFRYLLFVSSIIILLLSVLLMANAPIFSIETLLILVIVLSYCSFWFGLCYYVNSLWRNSGYNATYLVSAWLILLIILPAILNAFIQKTYPMPSRIDLITLNRSLGDKAREKGNQLLSVYYEDHPELVPQGKTINFEDFALKSFAINTDIRKTLKPVQENYNNVLASQQQLVSNFRFASPGILMQESLNNLAGVGYERYTDFESQVTDYQQSLFDFIGSRIFKMTEMSVSEYDKIPIFQYQNSKSQLGIFENFGNVFFLLLISVMLIFIGNKKISQNYFN